VHPVNRRPIGRTGVRVTELGFGGAPIGNLYSAVDEATAAGAVAAAWDAGVRYFDTAPHYGLGLSERRLGNALAARPRAEFAVSTKVGRLLVSNPSPSGTDLAAGFDIPDTLTRRRDYSADGVRRSLDASMERLGLDRIDIALVHDPEDHMQQAMTDAVPALVKLREEGVVGAVGVGMNYWEPLLSFVTGADIDVVMVAGRWTLADRSAAPLLAACAEQHVSVLAAAPFNSGLLAHPWPAAGALFDYRPVPAGLLEAARSLAAECTRHGGTLPHAAVSFPLRHPSVASVVAGIRTAEQARSDAGWAATPLPGELWDRAEKIISGIQEEAS
jgi:D-threo-aldose 1-dehydrogenase